MPVRLGWIDSARGFAIVLVVSFHSAQWAASAGHGSPTWLSVVGLIVTMRMPLFFTLSGILAVKWMTRPWRELLTLKVAILLWLYLIWQAITAAVYLVVPNVSTPGKSNTAELITAIVTPLRPQGALWFIWALALFFVVCRALWNPLPRWLLIGAAALVSTLSFGGVFVLGNVGWDGAVDNFVFFAVGAVFAPWLKRAGDRLTLVTSLGAVLAWAAFLVAVPDWEAPGVNLVSRGLGLAAGIGIGYALSRLAVARAVGRNTLYLYLPHYIVLTVLAYAVASLPLPASAGAWLPVALLLTSVGVCAVLWGISRKLAFVRAAFIVPPWLVRLLRRDDGSQPRHPPHAERLGATEG